MVNFFIGLLIFSASTVLHATVETDILVNKNSVQPKISTVNDCPDCVQYKDDNCPESLDYLIQQTLNNTIYNMLIGNKLLNVCISKASKSIISNEKLNENLSTLLNQKLNVKSSQVLSCLKKNKVQIEKMDLREEDVAKLLSAYAHTSYKSLRDNQAEHLKQLAGIDQVLGKKPLENISCAETEKSTCEEIRKCGEENKLSDMVDFTMNAFVELAALKKQAQDLRMNLRLPEKDRAAGLKDLQEKNKFVKDMIPWLQGDFFKDESAQIIRNAQANKTADNRKLIEATLVKQLSATQKILKSRYTDNSLGLKCLDNKGACTPKIFETINSSVKKNYAKLDVDFSKYKSNDAASRNLFIESQETNLFLNSGSCVSKLLNAKKEVDEAVDTSVAAGIGLATWGFGGVFKLGQTAMKFYQAGNRTKGIGSIALLGGEAKSLSTSIDHLSKECTKALNQLNKEFDNDKGMCAQNPVSTFQVKNLNSCIVNISLTTLPYVLSLRSIKSKAGKYAEAESLKLIEEKRSLFLTSINNKLINEVDKKELAESLSKLNLTPDESFDIINKLNLVVKTEKDKNRLKNYIRFVLSLKPEEQKLAIDKLQDVVLISNKYNPGGYVEKFYLKENKFYIYEQYKKKNLIKQLEAQGKSPARAADQAEEIARLNRSNLQNRFYACHSKTITPEIVSAAKKFTAFSIALGVGGTTYGYYNNNKEKLVENKAEFVGKLSYDIAMSYLLSKIGAKISSQPSGGMVKRYVAGNVATAQIGLLEAFTYSKLYGVSEDEARRKIEEIANSKEAMNELKMLDKYIEKEGVVDQFKNAIISTYKEALNSPDKEKFLGKYPGIENNSELKNLTSADLERPEVREKVVKAILLDMNSGGVNALIATGDKGADRWVNDRLWNAAIGIPKGLVVGMGVFQVLCLGADSPMLSLGVASGIQFANQFLSSDGYYSFKKTLINQ